MNRFFIEKEDMSDGVILLRGDNLRHLSSVLRAKVSDEVLLCDGDGNEYLCRLTSIKKDYGEAQIVDVMRNAAEPSVRITLFQCLPKSDKMDFICEKSVELGVCEIIPVLSSRCISRPDDATLIKKISRWQAICESAAKQSGRGIIPTVSKAIGFEESISQMKTYSTAAMFYEHTEKSRIEKENFEGTDIAILIGPEGGFSEEEAAFAEQNGVRLLSLGKRILRCETAPVTALSVILYVTGNL